MNNNFFQEPSVQVRASNVRPQHWPYGVVPYVISNTFNDQERANIIADLQHIVDQTTNCVRFVPQYELSEKIRDFVVITKTNNEDGCHSVMGRSFAGGRQFMVLNEGCLTPHNIIHEATHVLGFDHTQCRSDRDQYMRIKFENVIPEMRGNFDTRNTNNELVAFDPESVMIYEQDTFTANGLDTMELKSGERILEDNRRAQLSSGDIEMIKRFYRCARCP